jgi:DNA-binding transcriptional LysR family regulator
LEDIDIRPMLATNSLAVLRHFGARDEGATLMGTFSVYREIRTGDLAGLPIAHPLFKAAKARVLVKSRRPLGTALTELLSWIVQRMAVFAW